jgi:hypothetical protein
VQGLVLLANERMRSNQLVGGNDSAHAYLLAARRLDPADPGVQQGVTALVTLLQRNAREAIREGRLDEAGGWVHNAIALDVNRTEVAQLRSELEVARLGNLREDRARLLMLANQRIAQDRLIEPVADSARHYLDLLRASDPTYEGLPETSALLAAGHGTGASPGSASDPAAPRTLKAAAGAEGARTFGARREGPARAAAQRRPAPGVARCIALPSSYSHSFDPRP